ncbi:MULTISPECIES: DUF6314 family protein [unclassified Streptomyces]|uniref:DUF6314 family protein n=1 Tax=unclassified Streptomyces TaxID=2593676 RepID=UPI002E1357D8|nr:DUF6314 family protein [Streptomyces sp. NBC_01197]WSS53291.1 DUF6314 family protein [Streptomyces sp. NBC_01180]
MADTLGYLAGRWRVERSVYDLSEDRYGRFRGTTDFVRGELGVGLRQVERGEFTWGGVTRPACREYLLEPAGDGAAFVRFADGRPFHALDLRDGRCVAGHPCAEDVYRGEFGVVGVDCWWVVWRVCGPAKDLRLVTLHHRI